MGGGSDLGLRLAAVSLGLGQFRVVQASKKITKKTTEVVRPCEENERGAHK